MKKILYLLLLLSAPGFAQNKLGDKLTPSVRAVIDAIMPPTVKTISQAGIVTAISSATAGGRTAIMLPVGSYPISGTLTIPVGVKIYIPADAKFTGSGTIVAQGEIVAGKLQIFATTLTVRINTTATTTLYPEWWGAKPMADPRNKEISTNVNSTTALQKTFDAPLPPNGYSGNNKNRVGPLVWFSGDYATTREVVVSDIAGLTIDGISSLYGGSGVRGVGTPSDTTESVLNFYGCDFLTVRNISVTAKKGNTRATRRYAAVRLTTQVSGSTQRQATFQNVTIGDLIGTFDDQDAGYMFEHGLISDGTNTNNDFHRYLNGSISYARLGIRQTQNQAVRWTLDNVQFGFCEWGYKSDLGGGQHIWNKVYFNAGMKKGYIYIAGGTNAGFEGEFHGVAGELMEGDYFLFLGVPGNVRFYDSGVNFYRDGTNTTAPKFISALGYSTNIEFHGGTYYGVSGSNPAGLKAEIEYTTGYFKMNTLKLVDGFELRAGLNLVKLQNTGQVKVIIDARVVNSVNYGPARQLTTIFTSEDARFTGSSPVAFDLYTLFAEFPAVNYTEVTQKSLRIGEGGREPLLSLNTYSAKTTTPTSGTVHQFSLPAFLPAKTQIDGVVILGMQSLVAGDGVASVGDYVTVGVTGDLEKWGRITDVNTKKFNDKPYNSGYYDTDTDVILRRYRGRGVNRVFTQSGNTVTGNADFFHSSDVGRTIEWLTGPQAGTTATISAVSGNTATVSNSTTQATSEQLRIRMEFVLNRQIEAVRYTRTVEGIDKILPDLYNQTPTITISTP